MTRVMLILILWFSVVEAPAVVVVTKVQKRLYDYLGYPEGKTLDVHQDGAADFQFRFTTYVTTDVPSSAGSTSLGLRSTGESSRIVVTEPGSLLGDTIFPASGEAALWPLFDFGRSICSRGFSMREPAKPDSFGHLGGTSIDGYLGFRLSSSEGNTFGYLHFQFVDWTTSSPFGFEFAGNPMLVGWALENAPNTAIKVVPIPEPCAYGMVAACGLALSLRRLAGMRCLR